MMLQDLAPLIGRRLSVGVVPDWHGEWPLAAHPDYCRLLRAGAEERLLHGYFHRRRPGLGPISVLAERCDEMNGLDRDETRRLLSRGQQMLAEAFGAPARGFLAPGWQRGHVRLREDDDANALGLEYVLGFRTLDSRASRRVRLATWTWDCGRWGWLGYVGESIGWLRQSRDRAVPVLAIHPRDLRRGFWPRILRLTEGLLERGYEPSSLAGLLSADDAASPGDVAV